MGSAKKANLVADDWKTNAAGFNVSHAFGFGLMDAGKMVERAERWEKVPQQKKCSHEYDGGEESVRAGWQKRLNITVDDCDSVQVESGSAKFRRANSLCSKLANRPLRHLSQPQRRVFLILKKSIGKQTISPSTLCH